MIPILGAEGIFAGHWGGFGGAVRAGGFDGRCRGRVIDVRLGRRYTGGDL